MHLPGDQRGLKLWSTVTSLYIFKTNSVQHTTRIDNLIDLPWKFWHFFYRSGSKKKTKCKKLWQKCWPVIFIWYHCDWDNRLLNKYNCKYTQQNKKIRQTRNEKRITLVKLLIWKAELDMFTCNIKFLLCAYFFLHFPTHSSKRSLLSFLL